jgi:hypothetical protein
LWKYSANSLSLSFKDTQNNINFHRNWKTYTTLHFHPDKQYLIQDKQIIIKYSLHNNGELLLFNEIGIIFKFKAHGFIYSFNNYVVVENPSSVHLLLYELYESLIISIWHPVLSNSIYFPKIDIQIQFID